jgi:hypothetical protein
MTYPPLAATFKRLFNFFSTFAVVELPFIIIYLNKYSLFLSEAD